VMNGAESGVMNCVNVKWIVYSYVGKLPFDCASPNQAHTETPTTTMAGKDN